MTNHYFYKWHGKQAAVVVPSWIVDDELWLAPNINDPFFAGEIVERGIELQKYADQKRPGSFFVKRCSKGGGIIFLDYPDYEWSTPALMGRRYLLRYPWGTRRNQNPGISVVIPITTPKHRVKELPIPKAPSPAFSIELCSDSKLYIAVTSLKGIGKNWAVEFKQVLGEFGWQAKVENGDPKTESGFDNWLKEKELDVLWLLIDASGESIKELFAGVIYAGMSLSIQEMKNVFSIHLVASISDLPGGFLTAQQWHKQMKPVRLADQW